LIGTNAKFAPSFASKFTLAPKEKGSAQRHRLASHWVRFLFLFGVIALMVGWGLALPLKRLVIWPA